MKDIRARGGGVWSGHVNRSTSHANPAAYCRSEHRFHKRWCPGWRSSKNFFTDDMSFRHSVSSPCAGHPVAMMRSEMYERSKSAAPLTNRSFFLDTRDRRDATVGRVRRGVLEGDRGAPGAWVVEAAAAAGSGTLYMEEDEEEVGANMVERFGGVCPG